MTTTRTTSPPATSRRSVDVSNLREQLEPVRAALRADAEQRAAEILDQGRRTANATVATAQAASDEAVSHACDRAVATAQAQRQQAQAAARRDVHRDVLVAEADLRRTIVDGAVTAASSMVDDPRYPLLLDRLEMLAHRQLGPDAVVLRDPADGPGLVATAGARRVDYRLATLARRALDARGDLLTEAPLPGEDATP
jgi:hypothetical protein